MKILNKLYALTMMSLPLVSILISYFSNKWFLQTNYFFVIPFAIVVWFVLHSLGLLLIIFFNRPKSN